MQQTQVAPTVVAFLRSIGVTGLLLARRRIRLSEEHVGLCVPTEDGSHATVYRETVLDHAATTEPAVLAVAFRLRLIGTSRAAHRLFRAESLLNTPLFAGFPGFRSKLWLHGAGSGVYRGIYQWDGAGRATAYATSLVRLLAPLCVAGSVSFRVVPDTWLRADGCLLGAYVGPSSAREVCGGPDGTDP